MIAGEMRLSRVVLLLRCGSQDVQRWTCGQSVSKTETSSERRKAKGTRHIEGGWLRWFRFNIAIFLLLL